MARFIIAHGIDAECEIIDAPDLGAAVARAREYAQAKGMSVEDSADEDVNWAKPYSDELADELGMRVIDDLDASRAAWKSAAPWR